MINKLLTDIEFQHVVQLENYVDPLPTYYAAVRPGTDLGLIDYTRAGVQSI